MTIVWKTNINFSQSISLFEVAIMLITALQTKIIITIRSTIIIQNNQYYYQSHTQQYINICIVYIHRRDIQFVPFVAP